VSRMHGYEQALPGEKKEVGRSGFADSCKENAAKHGPSGTVQPDYGGGPGPPHVCSSRGKRFEGTRVKERKSGVMGTPETRRPT